MLMRRAKAYSSSCL